MSDSNGCKKKLAKNLAIDGSMTVKKANELIDYTLKTIAETLAIEGRIELRNFGVFEVVKTPPRKARNPKTGEVVFVPKTYKVKFKPGKEMILKVLEENKKIDN